MPSSPFYAYTFSKELVDEWAGQRRRHASRRSRLPRRFADRFDLKKDIQLETWVTDARWDERHQRWVVDTDGDERVAARFLVCAVGALFVANMPDYPGFHDFAGEVYHTGRWPANPCLLINVGSSGQAPRVFSAYPKSPSALPR